MLFNIIYHVKNWISFFSPYSQWFFSYKYFSICNTSSRVSKKRDLFYIITTLFNDEPLFFDAHIFISSITPSMGFFRTPARERKNKIYMYKNQIMEHERFAFRFNLFCANIIFLLHTFKMKFITVADDARWWWFTLH